MKRILALVTAAILTLGTCTTVFAAEEVSGEELLKSAEVHIDFEDSVQDLNGNYTPVFNGAETYVEGRFGKAASVSNGGGHIAIPDMKFGTESFTITTWLYMHAWSGDPAIFSNKDWGSGSNPGFVLIPQSNAFKLNANAMDSDRFDSAWATERWIDDPTALEQWVHLALVVDREAGTVSFCINGGEPLLAKEMVYETELEDTANYYPLCFGDDGLGAYNSGQMFIADYDEVAVFKQALTLEEIQAIYTYAPEGYEPAVLEVKEEAAEEPTEDAAEEPTEDAAEEPTEDAAEEPTEDAAEEAPAETEDSAITGTVIGVVVAVLAIAAIAVVVVKKKK